MCWGQLLSSTGTAVFHALDADHALIVQPLPEGPVSSSCSSKGYHGSRDKLLVET